VTPELEQAYRDSCQPFIVGGGAITEREAKMQPWRVFLEISSACNLFCPSCTKGNQKSVEGRKYEHQSGFMDPDLMERILDKIKSENPEAICFLYGNSEPWLHPRLPECITAVKKRGLGAQFSTNLNHMQRVEETLAAQPDMIIVSLSGFTQDVYEKGHAGGKIERVKANMATLGTFNQLAKPKVRISVNYHVYTDNSHEIEPMRAYATECGLEFFTSTARAISMENTIQWLREKDGSTYEVQEDRPDWNKVLPKPSQQWRDTMARLKIPPDKAREMYAKYPVSPVCPVGAGGIFTFIRHDGKTSMCSCVADRRITVGDYLTTTPDEMIAQRTNHAICQQCIKYRLNLYYMICDRGEWD
jgi:pyruvate-formate lyase-activating enzyme